MFQVWEGFGGIHTAAKGVAFFWLLLSGFFLYMSGLRLSLRNSTRQRLHFSWVRPGLPKLANFFFSLDGRVAQSALVRSQSKWLHKKLEERKNPTHYLFFQVGDTPVEAFSRGFWLRVSGLFLLATFLTGASF